jgi:hypothetical protein
MQCADGGDRPVPLFIPMRLHLSYGAWTEQDGARVLFSRDYKPLWRLKDGEKPARMNPWERIRFEKQEWFWDDTTTPWSTTARYEQEIKRLQDFGVTALPRLVETLPYLVLRDDLTSANNPQQSWGFDGEPPEAVIKESGTRDGTS